MCSLWSLMKELSTRGLDSHSIWDFYTDYPKVHPCYKLQGRSRISEGILCPCSTDVKCPGHSWNGSSLSIPPCHPQGVSFLFSGVFMFGCGWDGTLKGPMPTLGFYEAAPVDGEVLCPLLCVLPRDWGLLKSPSPLPHPAELPWGWACISWLHPSASTASLWTTVKAKLLYFLILMILANTCDGK